MTSKRNSATSKTKARTAISPVSHPQWRFQHHKYKNQNTRHPFSCEQPSTDIYEISWSAIFMAHTAIHHASNKQWQFPLIIQRFPAASRITQHGNKASTEHDACLSMITLHFAPWTPYWLLRWIAKRTAFDGGKYQMPELPEKIHFIFGYKLESPWKQKFRFWTEMGELPGWKDCPISAAFELLLTAPTSTVLCCVLYLSLILIVKRIGIRIH